MIHGRKFGRVVKAVALGAILVRGRGSNPLACTNFLLSGEKKKKKPQLPFGFRCTQTGEHEKKKKKGKKDAFCGNRTHAIRDDYDLNVAP